MRREPFEYQGRQLEVRATPNDELQRAFCHPRSAARSASTIAWFKARGVRHGAITSGARPILGWDGERGFEIEIPRVPVLDTLGAGDVLHGAFCHYFPAGAGFEDALRRAAGIATLSVQTAGVRAWSVR